MKKLIFALSILMLSLSSSHVVTAQKKKVVVAVYKELLCWKAQPV